MNQTKFRQRPMPRYTAAEEIANMVTHIAGGALALCVLALCVIQATGCRALTSCLIYGCSMLLVYTISSIYHGLKPGTGKKVFQVLDHCAIYFLIAGTYTPIMVCGFVPCYPVIGWGLLAAQWGLLSLAVTLTAIDLKKYKVFSMVCYILMGWSIILFLPQALEVLGDGFRLILAGGITYTIGAILFGIGSKTAWFHSAFHVFVLGGSFLQFLGIYLYIL